MQDEDSSSVNVNFIIDGEAFSSDSIVEIIFASGEKAYTRLCYAAGCEVIKELDSSYRLILNEAEPDILYRAIRCYNAENEALKYLERAEHSERSLYIKLIKKGFSKEECSAALSYLSSCNYLNDKRFAEAWLSARIICKPEGRLKLLSELCARGVSFPIAEKVLNEIIDEQTEKQLCFKALYLQKRKGFTGEKLIYSMQRLGFSSNLIKDSIECFSKSNEEN